MADVVSEAHKVGKCFGQDSGFDRLHDMLLETCLDCDEPMGVSFRHPAASSAMMPLVVSVAPTAMSAVGPAY